MVSACADVNEAESFYSTRMDGDCREKLGVKVHDTALDVSGFVWTRPNDPGCFPCAPVVLGGYEFIEATLGEIRGRGQPVHYPREAGMFRFERVARTDANADACARFDEVNERMGHLIGSFSAASFGIPKRVLSSNPEIVPELKRLYLEQAETICVRTVRVSEFSANYEFAVSDVFLGNFPANDHRGYYKKRVTIIRSRNDSTVLAESVDRFTYLNPGSYGAGSGNSRSCGDYGSTIDVSDVLVPRTSQISLDLQEILNSVRGN